MKVAIVIPAHNEAETIRNVVAGAGAFGLPIVVDDGSQDGTGNLADEAGAQVVRHDRNRGYDAALQSGFERASALDMEIVVTLDADGQHDARVIADLVAPLESGEAELVIGVRSSPARWTERVFGAYTNGRYGVPDILCGAKAYGIELFHYHGRFDSSSSIGTELVIASLQRKGVRFCTVPVGIGRRAGKSRFGGRIRANGRILRALVTTIWNDLEFRRRSEP